MYNSLTPKKANGFMYAVLFLSILLFAPFVTFAINGSNELENFGIKILNFINDTLVPFLFAVALLLFIYGVFKYFIQGGSNPDEQKQGQKYVLWSIAGLVVVVSIWGIVGLIAGGLNFEKKQLDTKLIPSADVRPGN